MGTSKNEEMVSHPVHYTQHPSGIECKDVIKIMMMGIASPIKYIWRHGLKTELNDSDSISSSIRDLKKARKWLEFHLEYLEMIAYDGTNDSLFEYIGEAKDRVLNNSDMWDRPVFNAIRMLLDEYEDELSTIKYCNVSNGKNESRISRIKRIISEIDKEISILSDKINEPSDNNKQ